MKKYIQDGKTKQVDSSPGYVSGNLYKVGTGLIGVANATIETGKMGVLQTEGVVTVPKAAGVLISDGDPLYLDSNLKVTNIDTTAGLQRAGTAWGDAGTASLEVDMKLMGGHTLKGA